MRILPERRARFASESGFTMLELLVAATIGIVLIGTAVGLFTSAIRAEPERNQRAAQIQQARFLTERITRELRQGSNAQVPTPAELMILTYVPRLSCTGPTPGPAIRCRVFYSCTTAGTCVRTQCPPAVLVPPAGCAPATEVVSGLSSDAVFTFSPRTPGQAFVGVKLAFPAQRGDDAITVEDGVALRNPPLGSS